jgi:formylglycine-generating enzyme required for sulfatase activity
MNSDHEPVWRDWLRRSLSVRESHGLLRLLPLALLENAGTEAVREFYDAAVAGVESMPLDSACEVIAVLTRPLRDLSLRGFPILELSDKWKNAIAKLTLDVDALSYTAGIPLASRVSLASADALSRRLPVEKFTRIVQFSRPDPFIIGAQAGDQSRPNFDMDAAPWERVPQEVTVQPFGIAVFPVTVAEYEQFVEGGGYQSEIYWSDNGLQTLRSNDWSQPLDWEQQLTSPSCPVTGVSYFEAQAYASWASKVHVGCRLLTEAEWEYAARHGLSTRFPWGDELTYGNSAEANLAGAGLRLKTPVGLFARYGTADGVQDMIGNVEEWCADKWSADQVEYEHIGLEGKFVVKGGSCIRYRRLCRPAYRSRVLAWARYHTLGFRLGFDSNVVNTEGTLANQ